MEIKLINGFSCVISTIVKYIFETVCKIIDVAGQSIKQLESHMQGKKHKQKTHQIALLVSRMYQSVIQLKKLPLRKIIRRKDSMQLTQTC